MRYVKFFAPLPVLGSVSYFYAVPTVYAFLRLVNDVRPDVPIEYYAWQSTELLARLVVTVSAGIGALEFLYDVVRSACKGQWEIGDGRACYIGGFLGVAVGLFLDAPFRLFTQQQGGGGYFFVSPFILGLVGVMGGLFGVGIPITVFIVIPAFLWDGVKRVMGRWFGAKSSRTSPGC